MTKQDLQPSKVLEESIGDLNAQVKQVLGRMQYILEGKKPPEVPQHAIAVLINKHRARAHINRVACTEKNSIICWATATPEGRPDLRHKINLIFREDRWIVSVKFTTRELDDEDIDTLH